MYLPILIKLGEINSNLRSGRDIYYFCFYFISNEQVWTLIRCHINRMPGLYGVTKQFSAKIIEETLLSAVTKW